jgi:hypothetical protein
MRQVTPGKLLHAIYQNLSGKTAVHPVVVARASSKGLSNPKEVFI